MNPINTNLVGRTGTAEIWRDVASPVEVVAVVLMPASVHRNARIEATVRLTESGPFDYMVKGQLHVVAVTDLNITSQ